MLRYDSLARPLPRVPISLTIGAFDGIHLGHVRLISETCVAAARIGGQSAVMTFEPHPARVLRPASERRCLTTLDERVQRIEALGIDHLFILRFDPALASIPAESFMEQICQVMDLRELWIGPDFRLGAGGRGTAKVLAEIGRRLGYTVHHVERVYQGDQPVSSTSIREMLAEGAVEAAAQLLGRLFEVRGEVVHGDHRGRTIGIPTANVAVPGDHVLPADGVYACRVYLPDEVEGRPAVTNIGVRPTFGEQRHTVEAHLLDWSGDLYEEVVGVEFVRRLRGEQRFNGIEALLAQIHADIAAAREDLLRS